MDMIVFREALVHVAIYLGSWGTCLKSHWIIDQLAWLNNKLDINTRRNEPFCKNWLLVNIYNKWQTKFQEIWTHDFISTKNTTKHLNVKAKTGINQAAPCRPFRWGSTLGEIYSSGSYLTTIKTSWNHSLATTWKKTYQQPKHATCYYRRGPQRRSSQDSVANTTPAATQQPSETLKVGSPKLTGGTPYLRYSSWISHLSSSLKDMHLSTVGWTG